MRLLSALLIAPVWLAAQSAPSAPADTTGKKADPPPQPVNHLETALAGVKLTGFVEASYAYSARSLDDTAIVGRLYDRFQNRFTLNALGVVLDKPYDPAKFSDHVDVQLRVNNGWDQASDNNSRKSLMGRVGVYPDAVTSLGIVGFWGPEEAGINGANRYGVDGVLWRKLGKAAVSVQGDYGKEQANAALPDPTQDAQWWAFGGWVTYDFNPSFGLALRGDYMNDEDGARTSGVLGFPANTGQKLGSGTATLNVRAWPNAVVRPELRYDRSSLAAFDGKKDQLTLALAVAYLY